VKEKLALLFMKLVADNYYGRKAPWTADALAVRANAPMEATTFVLEGLVGEGVLTRAGEDVISYVPARPLDTMTIAELIDAIRAADEDGYITDSDVRSNPAVDGLQRELADTRVEALKRRTVKDLAGKDDDAKASADVTMLPKRDGDGA
jgi:hypothetical protein